MSELEHRLTKVEQIQEMQGGRLVIIENDIKDIVKLLSSRPTWLITSMITVLTTVTASLIVYVSTHA